ncbi:hypothetical protein C6P40_002324 [Pichia californica]|uniref:PH domain-containing protein n=1 Tax=Pichia californica TaxID=460514 RepID=A0A9P7BI92_9ASCO|nr:hypothetical protein C6P42_002566 [[Candida] californica]KAG0690573.1 hypothetical protein C6P40_002324 [[Candida] californica]
MSLVSQEQILQNQLQLKQLENQRTKQVQQSKSLDSTVSMNANSLNPIALQDSKNTNTTSMNSSLVQQQQQQQQQIQQQVSQQQQQAQQIQAQQQQAQAIANAQVQAVKQKIQAKKIVSPQILSDPQSITVPTNANPTDILAARFNSWRIIISALSHYLKETVSVHEEITRQQIRLHHAISFPFLTQGLDGEFYQPTRLSNTNQPQSSNISSTIFHSSKDNQDFNYNDSSSSNSSTTNSKTNEFDLAKKFFLPLGSGSIQDLPTILYQYHSNAAILAQSTVKELNSTIIPRLEDLKRDLLVKIKEIKSLQSDFKNQVGRYQTETSRLLSTYVRSIDYAKSSPSQLDSKNDPYLIKFALDRSIKRQLSEENYLHEAFINIQTSAKELEKVVYIELQTALTVYAKLLGQQAQNVFDSLISKLDSSILTKDPTLEWDSFIDRDQSNFIELDLPMRRVSEIRYKYQHEALTYEIRSGYLERKSKFLKSYQRAWYVLTSCFLHEFKSSDRRKDPLPERSLALSELTVTEHSRKDEKNPNGYHKFVIMHGQSAGLLHKGHNWVFRVESYDLMMAWYNDIKKLTQMQGPVPRSVIAMDRRRSRRNNNNNNNNSTGTGISSYDTSTATSISTARKRGVSSATAQTTQTNNTETETNMTPINGSPIQSTITNMTTDNDYDKLSSNEIPKTSDGKLNREQTGVSSLSIGLSNDGDVVVVPIKTEPDDTPDKKIPLSNNNNHTHGQISQLNSLTHSIIQPSISDLNDSTKYNILEQKLSYSNPQSQAPATLAEQQALLLQQQALLEQKQRQLLEEQRELQQRAFSLTSSVQQQYQQQVQQHAQQPAIHTLSLKSETSGDGNAHQRSASLRSGKIDIMKTVQPGVEELSEKVGELGIDESR